MSKKTGDSPKGNFNQQETSINLTGVPKAKRPLYTRQIANQRHR